VKRTLAINGVMQRHLYIWGTSISLQDVAEVIFGAMIQGSKVEGMSVTRQFNFDEPLKKAEPFGFGREQVQTMHMPVNLLRDLFAK
jgi:hypothetical protein